MSDDPTSDLQAHLESLNLSPKNKAAFESIAKSIEQRAREAADEIQETIAPGGQVPPEQTFLTCAPMPTDLCRISPFFPLAPQALGERPFLESFVITESGWGLILYTGPKLAIQDEDVLLAVLSLIFETNHRLSTMAEGKITYTYKGPFLPILRRVWPKMENPGKTQYKQALRSLKLLLSAVIEMQVSKRTTRGKRRLEKILMTNALAYVHWDENAKELTVTVNPYFYECYKGERVTILHLEERAELTPIGKALYRFVISHRDDVWQGHFLTLAGSMNLDLNQPVWKIKDNVKRTVKELVTKGVLEKSSGFFQKSDEIKLLRQKRSKRLKKLKK